MSIPIILYFVIEFYSGDYLQNYQNSDNYEKKKYTTIRQNDLYSSLLKKVKFLTDSGWRHANFIVFDVGGICANIHDI